MTQLVMESVVDENGVLKLLIPIGKDKANRRVRVTIDHISEAESEAERKARIRTLVGSWQGEFEPIGDLPPDPMDALP
ncbi:MAG TPA: hypothetical protein VM510_11190 [Caulifigura sp.]|jgi:hypothetical protein|nr:hypothetical protein [Caulifigura sp.]